MIVGRGLTVMVKVLAKPRQPLSSGVTVMVAIALVVPEFWPVNAAILPVPPAARPILGFCLSN